VTIVPDDNGKVRNVVPKAIEDLLKSLQAEAWKRESSQAEKIAAYRNPGAFSIADETKLLSAAEQSPSIRGARCLIPVPFRHASR